jgi:hypothetical protein
MKDMPAKERDEMAANVVAMHRHGAENGASPRSFFALIDTYREVYSKKVSSRGSQA